MKEYSGPYTDDTINDDVIVVDHNAMSDTDVNDLELREYEEDPSEPEPIFDPETIISLSSDSRKKKRYIMMGVWACVLIALVVGISVPVSRHNKQKELESPKGSNAEATSTDTEAEEVQSEISTDGRSNDDTGGYMDVSKGFKVNLSPFSDDILSGYPSCSDLLTDVEEAGKYLANAIIKNRDYYETMPMVMAATSADYSNTNSYETNNQVDGVDEADFVKSDGKLVYIAYGNELVIMKPGEDTILSRTEMPQVDYSFPIATYWQPEKILEEEDNEEAGKGTAFTARSSVMPPYYSPTQSITGMLFHRDRLVVIVSGFQYSSTLVFLDGGMTGLYIYDVDADTGALSLVDKKTIRGSFRDARAIDNKAHVVTYAGINTYLMSSYLRDWMFPQGITELEYRAKAFHRANAMIPQFARQIIAELLGNKQDGSVEDYKCGRIVGLSIFQTGGDLSDDIPDLTSGNGILNSFVQTTSFDIGTKFALSESVSGAFLPSGMVELYASKMTMVISGQGWGSSQNAFRERTFLLGFDVSNNQAVPSFVGQVPGYLLNRFSMDYYDGHLRVATTNSAKWGTENGEWTQQEESHSQITVLKKDGNQLTAVGEVRRLAPGERIYSVRFLKERGFVVTFRQVDPFFTFDLSDPTDPVQVGELKIRGYSNYLHPVGENFILAVGQDADEETGRPMGLQVALFNVTDFAHPKQIQKAVVSNPQEGSSNSEAQYDHHAFRFIEEVNTLILPVSKYSYHMDASEQEDDSFDGFYIYHVDPYEGITKAGEVIHADSTTMSRSCFSWYYLPARSMVFGGELMTMKGHSIVMSDLADTSQQKWKIDLDAERTLGDEAGCMPWIV